MDIRGRLHSCPDIVRAGALQVVYLRGIWAGSGDLLATCDEGSKSEGQACATSRVAESCIDLGHHVRNAQADMAAHSDFRASRMPKAAAMPESCACGPRWTATPACASRLMQAPWTRAQCWCQRSWPPVSNSIAPKALLHSSSS